MVTLRLLLLVVIIGAAVSVTKLHPDPAPTSLIDATPTLPRTSTPATTPRPTPTRASRTRTVTADPRPGSGSHLNWAALRECESSGNYHDRDSTRYRGAYQFDRQTWASVGGVGDPAAATPAEQDMRARRLYAARGRQPWPICGRRL